MAHHCPACLVTCEDFRLHRRKDGRNFIGEFVRSLGVDCDVITRAGGVQDMVRPGPGFDESLLRDIGVSVELHLAGTIYLINHQDCGAYTDFNFASVRDELQRHEADLREAAGILSGRFADVSVVMMFAELEPGSDGRFVIRQLPSDPPDGGGSTE